MKAREARKWLKATPTARSVHRYRADVDKLVTSYSPNLAGRDVMLPGDPLDYPTTTQAIEAARRFQSAIASKHPLSR